MKNMFFILSILAVALSAHADVILFSTDFQNAALGSYTNNAIINASGAPYEQMKVEIGIFNHPSHLISTSKVEVVQFDVDRKMLAVTVPETAPSNNDYRYGRVFFTSKLFPESLPKLSIKGHNQIEAQFDVIFNSGRNAVEMDIFLGCGNDTAANGLTRFFMYNYARMFHYTNNSRVGDTQGNTQFTWGSNTYRVHLHGDMSNGLGAADFKWSFTVTRLSDNVVVHSASDLPRSCATGTVLSGPPDRFVINAVYVNSAPLDPTVPVLYFTNFHIKAYPSIRPTLFLLK